MQAELLTLPQIAEHKAALLASKLHVETSWQRQYEPGLHEGANGERIAATDRELTIYDASGKPLRTEQNGGLTVQLIGGKGPMTLRSLTEAYLNADFGEDDPPLRKVGAPIRNGDDALLETYLAHKNITGYYEREAGDVWATFRSLCDKPLKDCDRDDGRKLVAHYEAQDLKSGTIEKRVGWLRATVNLAIAEGRLKFNPFAGVVPERNDKMKRLPLSDADMRTIKRNLSRLGESDQLLLRVLATTGMRLSAAFEIKGEEKERGVRYCIIGAKTPQSLRRVPFPESVLPYLPKKVIGPLFTREAADPEGAASKILNRFLDEIGIDDPRKAIHSLRHRAQDRLRAAGCREDVRWAILGHEQETVAAGYGEGFPVPMLKRWIDKIGF